MSHIETSYLDFGRLEALSRGDSFLHRLDPRTKVLTTVFFVLAVISFDAYTVSALLPFLLYPAVLSGWGGLPVGYLLKRVSLVMPFALMVGLFNPLLDRDPGPTLGPLELSGGWLSFASILLRVFLASSAAFILIALTGMPDIALALERMKVPRIFVVQILFVYRYIFVLTEEAVRMMRAYTLRSVHGRRPGLGIYAQIVGHLLLRTLDRARRIYLAMVSRGFDGEVHTLRTFHLGLRDVIFLVGWVSVFSLFRYQNIPAWIERMAG